MKFRIKIQETKSGEKIYFPQCKLRFYSNWKNLVSNSNRQIYMNDSPFEYRKNISYHFSSEAESKEIISIYKESMEKKDAMKPVKTKIIKYY
jgi:hypothetical protein